VTDTGRTGPSALATAGRWLLAAAGLVVLFVAYQQWGTAVTHWQGQRDLRTRFTHEVATARSPGGTRRAPAAPYPGVGDPVGVIQIPSIGVDQVVVEGVQAAQLAVGPGHYPGTALPGQSGNAAIAGHRTTHGAPFYSLDRVRPGDVVVVTTLQGRFTYRVVRSSVVSPDDGAVLDASSTPELTLTTCNPKYSAAQRLVVVADLESPVAPTTPRPAASVAADVVGDPVHAAGTWVELAAALIALVVLVVAFPRVRRRSAPGSWVRWTSWLVVPAGVVLVLVVFASLDTLLPASF